MKIKHYLIIASICQLQACANPIGKATNVSEKEVVAKYMETNTTLVNKFDILVGKNKSLLVKHGRRYAKHKGMERTHILPAGTKITLTKIDRIQGDGFVLFNATGIAYPKGELKGVPFTHKWGYGGTSPQAPWEKPGKRLKKILGIE